MNTRPGNLPPTFGPNLNSVAALSQVSQIIQIQSSTNLPYKLPGLKGVNSFYVLDCPYNVIIATDNNPPRTYPGQTGESFSKEFSTITIYGSQQGDQLISDGGPAANKLNQNVKIWIGYTSFVGFIDRRNLTYGSTFQQYTDVFGLPGGSNSTYTLTPGDNIIGPYQLPRGGFGKGNNRYLSINIGLYVSSGALVNMYGGPDNTYPALYLLNVQGSVSGVHMTYDLGIPPNCLSYPESGNYFAFMTLAFNNLSATDIAAAISVNYVTNSFDLPYLP